MLRDQARIDDEDSRHRTDSPGCGTAARDRDRLARLVCQPRTCGGDSREQLTVAAGVARQLAAGGGHMCGVMVESNVLAGRQGPYDRLLLPGRSITEACLDFGDTAVLLSMLAQVVSAAATGIPRETSLRLSGGGRRTPPAGGRRHRRRR